MTIILSGHNEVMPGYTRILGYIKNVLYEHVHHACKNTCKKKYMYAQMFSV